MKLDKRSTQPLYAQLKDLLIERIKLGSYQPGQQIPSEIMLCEELDLSRPTVRQAIAELVSEGVLVIVKGKGTFVAAEPERIELKGFNPFLLSFLAARSLDGFTQLSVTQTDGDAETEKIFSLPLGANHPGFWSVSWRLEQDGQAFAVCRSLIPVGMFPDLKRDLEQNRRMIDIMANKYAYLPQKSVCRVFVRSAGNDESLQLDISRSAPVLVAASRLTSRSGNICEFMTAVMRADLVTLSLDAGRS